MFGESQTMSRRKHFLLFERYSKMERGLISPYSLLALARMFAEPEFHDAYLSSTE